MSPPIDYGSVNLPRWRQLIEDADVFLSRWDREAIRLGWTTLDLFGCGRKKPFARIDLAALVPLLNGQRVVEMDETGAMIEQAGQRHSRFTRSRHSPEQMAVWDFG